MSQRDEPILALEGLSLNNLWALVWSLGETVKAQPGPPRRRGFVHHQHILTGPSQPSRVNRMHASAKGCVALCQKGYIDFVVESHITHYILTDKGRNLLASDEIKNRFPEVIPFPAYYASRLIYLLLPFVIGQEDETPILNYFNCFYTGMQALKPNGDRLINYAIQEELPKLFVNGQDYDHLGSSRLRDYYKYLLSRITKEDWPIVIDAVANGNIALHPRTLPLDILLSEMKTYKPHLWTSFLVR